VTIDLSILEQDAFQEWLVEQRWFGSKSREVSSVEVAESISLRDELVLALVEARFGEGTHETYQVMLGETGFDAFADPACGREILHRMRSGSEETTEHGTLRVRASAARSTCGRSAWSSPTPRSCSATP
jgi:hypothetical protein